MAMTSKSEQSTKQSLPDGKAEPANANSDANSAKKAEPATLATPTKREHNGGRGTRSAPYALYAVAMSSIGFAIAHSIWPDHVDQTTAMFVALAVVALVADEMSKFEGLGIKLERAVNQAKDEVRSEIQERVNPVEEALVQVEKAVAPGRRGVSRPKKQERRLQGTRHHPNDPNKGKFGESNESNSRILRAEIEPLSGQTSAGCYVRVWVESTDPTNKPLKGRVTFHLHPTFGVYSKYDVDVVDGVAEDEFNSWGAFTIGAIADEGKTKLELDLVNVRGGTPAFYKN